MLYEPFVIFIDLFSQQSLGTIAKHLLKISYRTLKCLDRGDNLRLICPLLGGPKYMLFWTRKEKTNAI
jgi:hypothetical protein